MESRLHSLAEITPTTPKWKARIAVQIKLAPQDAKSTGIRLQKMILIDDEGNTVSAIIYGSDVATYQNTLTEGLTYIIKGAKLNTTPGFENQLANCKFQWTLNKRTIVIPEPNNPLEVGPLQYNVTSSQHFYRSLDNNSILAIACVFIDKKEPRSVTTKYDLTTIQDFVVVDAELKPFVVSFWGDILPSVTLNVLNNIANRPSAVLINLKVTEFSGISLNSTTQTVVLLDKTDSYVTRLDTWKEENRDAIDMVINTVDLFGRTIFRSPDRPLKFSTVTQAAATHTPQLFTLKVLGKFERENQIYYYTGCEQCFGSTAADSGEEFYCARCKVTKKAIPSIKLVITVYDNSGEIETVFFSTEASKLVGMPGDQFITNYIENPTETIKSLKTRLRDYSFILRIRTKVFKGIPDFTVHTLELVSDNNTLPCINIQQTNNTAATHELSYEKNEHNTANSALPNIDSEPAQISDDDIPLSALKKKEIPHHKEKQAIDCSHTLNLEFVNSSPPTKPAKVDEQVVHKQLELHKESSLVRPTQSKEAAIILADEVAETQQILDEHIALSALGKRKTNQHRDNEPENSTQTTNIEDFTAQPPEKVTALYGKKAKTGRHCEASTNLQALQHAQVTTQNNSAFTHFIPQSMQTVESLLQSGKDEDDNMPLAAFKIKSQNLASKFTSKNAKECAPKNIAKIHCTPSKANRQKSLQLDIIKAPAPKLPPPKKDIKGKGQALNEKIDIISTSQATGENMKVQDNTTPRKTKSGRIIKEKKL